MTSTNLPPDTAAALRDALRQGGQRWIARLYRHEILHARTVRGMQVEIMQEWNRTVIQPLLRAIASRLSTFDPRGTDVVFEAFPQLRHLEAEIRATVSQGSAAVRRLTTERLHELVKIDADWLAKNARKSLKIEAPQPGVDQLTRAVDDRPFLGERIEGWFKKTLEAPTADNSRRLIQTGLQRGLTTDEIVRGLRGTKANGYSDGVIGAQSLRDVRGLVQSAAAHASAVTRFESFEAIGVKKWRWLATLDEKTCPICGANEAGSPYPIGEGPTFPAHPSCRCSPAPWFGEPIGNRASVDGPVPAKTDFAEWLRDQPHGTQDEVFGKTRAAAWRSGDLSLRDMLGRDLQPLSLAELRRLDRIPDEPDDG